MGGGLSFVWKTGFSEVATSLPSGKTLFYTWREYQLTPITQAIY